MWRAVAGLVAAFMLAASWRRRLVVVTVTGVSMLPTLAPGDRLLVRRTRLRRVHVGQVAVVERPGLDDDHATTTRWRAGSGELVIKRVAAVPGDRTPAVCLRESAAAMPEWVPDSMFILLGDNSDRSYDSRHAGLIAGDLLVGVAVRRLRRSPAASAPPAGPATWPVLNPVLVW